MSLHSATKYLNGHSDLVAGVSIGKGEWIGAIKSLQNHLGGSLDPHACYLLHRGLRTLAVRVRQQNASALRIAEFLAGRSEVAKVNYPGLSTHPHHERARELFTGFGGMLSYELVGDAERALRFADGLQLALHGPSLGGTETLISVPARLSHAGMTPEERAAMGVSDQLLRMSVGLEDADDLIADITQSLERS